MVKNPCQLTFKRASISNNMQLYYTTVKIATERFYIKIFLSNNKILFCRKSSS